MAEKKTAADGSKRKGQKTRAELLEENKALKEQVKHIEVCCRTDREKYFAEKKSADKRIGELEAENESLRDSRRAWVRKCEALTGQLQETMEEREKLKGLIDDYLRAYYKLDAKHDELIRHPWRNLWRHIKEALGLA